MTAVIEAALMQDGICLLGKGVFCVSGVDMPDGTTLMGIGAETRILLDPKAESGYAVKMGSYCTVRSLSVLGAEAENQLPGAVGDRHGILFRGTATQKDWKDQPQSCVIDGCFIRSFSGGGITLWDTGYSTKCSVTASNCHILNCGAGIYIPHFSEYHNFTNIHCNDNLFGCINNGGNNVFANCGFNSNVTAFLIDNSHGQSNNNSHGSAVGCTFNHSGKNQGIGIQILGATSGYVFSGCQNFYSRTVVEDSTGIVFNAMNFGKDERIEVRGGSLTMFTSCVFTNMPGISASDNPLVKFENCFTRDGQTVRV